MIGLIIFWIIWSIWILLCLCFVIRIERVHRFRMKILHENPNKYFQMPSYGYMVWHFWKPLKSYLKEKK